MMHQQPETLPPLYELKQVSYSYEPDHGYALRHIDLTIYKGEWLWITGPSKSGKSTLCGILNGSTQAKSGGTLTGELYYLAEGINTYKPIDLAGSVGIVMQDAESSLIYDIVEDELAFGPENLCYPLNDIEQLIDQALSVVDMPDARTHQTSTLSGGQMQRISIASMLTLNPHVIILDHALASQDADAIKKIMQALRDLHAQGCTIIMATSRLDEALSEERVIVLEEGCVIADCKLSELCAERLIMWGCLPQTIEVPRLGIATEGVESHHPSNAQPLIELQQVSFTYNHVTKMSPLLQDIHLTLFPGDILALRGANGTGKTTLGKLIAGILVPDRGEIWHRGARLTDANDVRWTRVIGYVFQHPQHMFVTDSVQEEISFGMRHQLEYADSEIEHWLQQFGLIEHREQHPLTLSTMEQQLLCIAAVMILQPDVLILDEPTAGLSYKDADRIMQHCAQFAAQGGAVMVITHDPYVIEQWTNKQYEL